MAEVAVGLVPPGVPEMLWWQGPPSLSSLSLLHGHLLLKKGELVHSTYGLIKLMTSYLATN
jgi:hypothetical protein